MGKLRGQAKLGAVLSLGSYPVAVALNHFLKPGSEDTDELELDNKRWAVPVGRLSRGSSNSEVSCSCALDFDSCPNSPKSPRSPPAITGRKSQNGHLKPRLSHPRRGRPSGRMAAQLDFNDGFGNDWEARQMHSRLTQRRTSSARGRRVDVAARQILGAFLLEETGNVSVAFRGWRQVVQESRLERAHKLLR